MRYHALACDFDGTLAWDGQVDPPTVDALIRLRESGRKLVLVTGRTLKDLTDHLTALDIFDRLVVENGAVIHDPDSGHSTIFGERPSDGFVADLRARGVSPIALGEVIVATWHPHEDAVLETIAKHGLEHHIVFNKGAVMILPPGVNKATGLKGALDQLQISLRNTVCVGDAENDNAMFRECQLSVAVANALVPVKRYVDVVTTNDHGAGVVELIDRMIESDLSEFDGARRRHHVLLGWHADNTPVWIKPSQLNVLVVGTPGSGKSRFTSGVLGRLVTAGYQVLTIDPEGDYEHISGNIHLGDWQHSPDIPDIMRALANPRHSVIVDLLGTSMTDRKLLFQTLYAEVIRLQKSSGRPHRLIIDEAHHVWSGQGDLPFPDGVESVMLITVDPASLSRATIDHIGLVLAFGEGAVPCLESVAGTLNRPIDTSHLRTPDAGCAIGWDLNRETLPFILTCASPDTAHRRHRRKYAVGDMGPERSFYFRGPDPGLNIAARNVLSFLEIADTIDDNVWFHHLGRGDYSAWIEGAVGAPDVAAEIADIETDDSLNPSEARASIRKVIERSFAPPA